LAEDTKSHGEELFTLQAKLRESQTALS